MTTTTLLILAAITLTLAKIALAVAISLALYWIQSRLQSKASISTTLGLAVCISTVALMLANPLNWANFVHFLASGFAAFLLGRLVEINKSDCDD
jgi:hypothetical protein